MSDLLLDLLMPRRRVAVQRFDSYFEPFAAKTRAGVNVNEEIALTFSTVFLCTRIIAEPLASMPILAYRRKDDHDRELVGPAELPVMEVLTSPNQDMGKATWQTGRTMHQTNYGNGFSELVRDRRGMVTEMHPIHPDRVSIAPRGSGHMYEVANGLESPTKLQRDEMLHFCGALSDDGIWGRGIIRIAREMIGGAIATDRHGAAYFGSGAQPKGIVVAPGLKTADEKRDFRKQWAAIHAPGTNDIAILPKESSYTPIPISFQDQQFLESRFANRKFICELYLVPIYMIGESMPASNIETLKSDFITRALSPWAVSQEQELGRKLLTKEQRGTYFFEHDFSRMLRGDIVVRMNSYRVGITTGVLTINDCRRMENKPGIGPAGDVHYVPANMFTADDMLSGAYRSQQDLGQPPGSDHTGAPGDNPLDHEPAMKRLTSIQRADLKRQLADLQGTMEERKTEWLGAARSALLDVLSRMLTKESNAAQRVVDGRGNLEGWMREFYHTHEALLARAVAPACHALRLAGVDEMGIPSNLAAWLRARSTEELARSYNQDSREVFNRKLAAWPTERAEMLTAQILRQRAEQDRDEQGRFEGGGGDAGGGDAGGDGGSSSSEDKNDEEDADIQDERDAEDKELEEQREAEDNETLEERNGEDRSLQESRDKEDEAKYADRNQRDDAKEQQREAEDKDKAEQREAEDKQMAAEGKSSDEKLAVEIQRAKDDKRTEKERAKEDKQTDKSDRKEDRETERQREEKDRQIQSDRSKEDRETDKARQDADSARADDRAKEDRQREADRKK